MITANLQTTISSTTSLQSKMNCLQHCPSSIARKIQNQRTGYVWISDKVPYRILDVSDNLGPFLEYDNKEIMYRAISVLFGPDTNPHALTLAIKQVIVDEENKSQASIPCFRIYSRSGMAQDVFVLCTSEGGLHNGLHPRCCITFRSRSQSPQLRRLRVPRRFPHSSHRVSNNFVTGLEIHRTRLQTHPSRCDPSKLERDWNLLLPK